MESDETEVLKFKLNSCRYQERQQERISMFWEKKTKIRKHIIFYGRVQGVGFRYYAVQKANQLGLTGWVKNLYDGSVEMEVEGQEELIDQLIIFLQNRTYIWIERIDAKKIPLQQDSSFCEIY